MALNGFKLHMKTIGNGKLAHYDGDGNLRMLLVL